MHKSKENQPTLRNEPAILLVTRRLSQFFKVLSNPRRVLILQELRSGERDVSSLTDSLKVSQSTVSQQIAVLRAHNLIEERREGRAVFYRLRNPEIAVWMAAGTKFAGQDSKPAEGFLSPAEHAKSVWQQRGRPGEGAEVVAIQVSKP
ncbi:MAG TPA: metalloregulator ArsR/SmtB family transcription factor [Chroococcales cyanobacterium]